MIGVPTAKEAGGVPDPAALRAALAWGDERRRGSSCSRCPTTRPGRSRRRRSCGEVCAVAEEAGLMLVCDEIYRDLALRPGRVP